MSSIHAVIMADFLMPENKQPNILPSLLFKELYEYIQLLVPTKEECKTATNTNNCCI